MKRNLVLSMLAVIGVLASPSLADIIHLAGVVRDFKANHPDMQRSGSNFKVIQQMVIPNLGEDGNPVLNTSDHNATYRVETVDSFSQWYNDVPGVNITIPFAISLDNGQNESGGIYTYAVEKPQYFFPIDGLGWNDTATDKNGNARNFYFTYELHTMFTYTDPDDRTEEMVFSFTGDDDVWVFINGKLAVDIGGVHPQVSNSVNLDDDAASLELEPGFTYALDFFFAERYTTESNFRIETTLLLEEAEPSTVSPLFD